MKSSGGVEVLADMANETEKEVLTDKRVDPENIEVITKLADGIANELNNVLATIMGLASVLEADIPSDGSSYQDIQGILDASRRGLKLTRNLLGFAKQDLNYFEILSINDVVGKVKSIVQQNISKRIAIETHLDDNTKDIKGDASQIKKILLNLSVNAIEAIQTKGSITFTTKNVFLEQSDIEDIPNLRPGYYVRLQVSDTGIGMDKYTLLNAPKPFFTTKDPKKYSGLGLFSVINSVKKHGGDVTLYSREGMGTTITVYFPVYRPEEEKTREYQRRVSSGEIYRILIVDDEEMFRKASKRILERLGHAVIIASNGDQALEYYKKYSKQISFVILDLLMPDIDGSELFENLKKINPKIKVIVSTGYTREEPIKELMAKGAVGFIQKPYTMRQLASVFKKITNSSR